MLLQFLERAEKNGTSTDSAYQPSFYDAMPYRPNVIDDSADECAPAWVEFCAMLLDHAGLLEHGTSIGRAWLTAEGTEVLRFLREFGTEDGEDGRWPIWATAEVAA